MKKKARSPAALIMSAISLAVGLFQSGVGCYYLINGPVDGLLRWTCLLMIIGGGLTIVSAVRDILTGGGREKK